MRFDVLPYDVMAALIQWATVVGIVLGISFFVLLVTSFIVVGVTGPLEVLNQIKLGFVDWFRTSPRRVWALTKLTFKESLRRKAPGVLVVFGVLFLFAGWFLARSNADPQFQVKVYVSFVLGAISWLILPVVLLLSCWGLPDDIKARSLHTVVTKPVRKHEIVLGRIFGYCIVGGGALLIMSVVGYIWINRQLPPEGKALLIARVPVYGDISFKDREGKDVNKGVNVGDEWEFRSFVEGNTKARATWVFSDINDKALRDDGLQLESNFEVFRTYKGNIEKGVLGQFTLVNDSVTPPIRVPVRPVFEVHESRQNIHNIPKNLLDETGKPVQLMDVVDNGKLKVEVRCLSGQQFLGMARTDLFVRLPDRTFAESYFKGILGIGLMMVMIVVLGVMASCFVKGPVALLLTCFVLVMGRLARPFLEWVTSSQAEGGGVLESIYRIVTHMNPSVALADTVPNRIMQGVDKIGTNALWAVKYLFPDFKYFNMSEYVANGFDVPWSAAILPSLVLTVGYTIPWVIVGYYSLKLRELESK